jgi:hypothetical protein
MLQKAQQSCLFSRRAFEAIGFIRDSLRLKRQSTVVTDL